MMNDTMVLPLRVLPPFWRGAGSAGGEPVYFCPARFVMVQRVAQRVAQRGCLVGKACVVA